METLYQIPKSQLVERKIALRAFYRALEREAHVLKEHPDLLWQQLYNRLQWEDDLGEALLAGEYQKRSAAGMPAWMCQRVQPGESGAMLKTFAGHEDAVYAAKISPDGSFVVSAGHDNTLRVWDRHTGLLRFTIQGPKHRYQERGHTHWFSACDISPDGRWLVAAGSDPTLKVYDTRTGAELLALRGHQRTVLCCAVSQDGAWILSGGEDETLNVWDAKTGSLRQALDGHRATIQSCAFSPDGRWALSASADNTLTLWDRARGRAKTTLKGHQETVYACAFSPDGETIVSGGDDQTLILWRRTGFKKLIRKFEGHTGRIRSCAFSPDGKYIVSAGEDKTLRVWDSHSGVELCRVLAHNDTVKACSFSPDSQFILSASHDDTLKIWNFEALLQGGVFQDNPDTLVRLSFSPSGVFMMTTDPNGVLKIRDTRDGSVTHTLSEPSEFVEASAVSPDGRLAASCSRGELKIWETGSWEVIRTIPKVYARRIYFSPDSRVVIGAQWPNMFRAWTIGTGEQFRAMEVPTAFDEGAWRIDLRPDGRYLLYTNSFSPKLARFEIASGELVSHFQAHDHGLNKACYSPDGHWFLTASRDHTLKVWGDEKHTLNGHTDGVSDCAISPDGSWAVSASADGTLKIWDTPAGIERMTLIGHTQGVGVCDISPDGNWILSVGDDSLLKVWQVATGQEVACSYLLNPKRVRFHPVHPAILTLDAGGHYQALDLHNITYGPLVVTARQEKKVLTVSCPVCRQAHAISKTQLGTIVTCPNPACGMDLHLTPFTLGMY